MKRNQWPAILFALLLFCCGAAAGALAHRYFAISTVNAKSAEDFRQRYMSEMKSKLNLTPTQVSQLEVILDQTKEKYRAVREQYRPAMLKVKNEQTSRVKSILTAEQIPAYEQLVAEREQRFREQEERDRLAGQKREAAHRTEASH
ncbi:MAG: hypothetical protein M3Y24_03445 [Acidobacteriota bacterium]|nr:hypothetical protein [Acidobacteriota bacterium]